MTAPPPYDIPEVDADLWDVGVVVTDERAALIRRHNVTALDQRKDYVRQRGGRPPRTDRPTCPLCGHTSVAHDEAVKRAERVAERRCVQCAVPVDDDVLLRAPKAPRCASCVAHNKAQRQARRAEGQS